MGPLSIILRWFRNLLIRVNEGAVKLLARQETVGHPESVCLWAIRQIIIYWRFSVFFCQKWKERHSGSQNYSNNLSAPSVALCVVCCVTALSASLTWFSLCLTFAAGFAIFWLRVHWSLHIWNDYKGERLPAGMLHENMVNYIMQIDLWWANTLRIEWHRLINTFATCTLKTQAFCMSLNQYQGCLFCLQLVWRLNVHFSIEIPAPETHSMNKLNDVCSERNAKNK